MYKSDQKKYSSKRRKTKTEKFQSTANTNRAITKLELERGVDQTPLMRKRLSFSMLQAGAHRGLVLDEINERGMLIDGSETWYALLRLIKDDEGDDKTFLPHTDGLKALHRSYHQEQAS